MLMPARGYFAFFQVTSLEGLGFSEVSLRVRTAKAWLRLPIDIKSLFANQFPLIN
jgi:hypothetical protein